MTPGDFKDSQQSTRLSDALSCALQYRDDYTYWHSDRVVAISIEFGEALSLSNAELNLLAVAAAFHDIGKIGIPDRILKKPGKLNGDEWEVMKKHSEISSEITKRANSRNAVKVAYIVRHHHEQMGGGGYPDGLIGDEIPLLSRIIALTDSYDAMTSTRSYRPSLNHDKTIKTMAKEENKYDPEMLPVFFKVIERSPYRVT